MAVDLGVEESDSMIALMSRRFISFPPSGISEGMSKDNTLFLHARRGKQHLI
jgi:pimeloyl-ACP methyl ester carboxylesterase